MIRSLIINKYLAKEFLKILTNFSLILLSCLEINKIHPLIVFILGGLLFVGRFLHAKSFAIPGIDKIKRVQGMKCTLWSIRLMAAMLIFSLFISLI